MTQTGPTPETGARTDAPPPDDGSASHAPLFAAEPQGKGSRRQRRSLGTGLGFAAALFAVGVGVAFGLGFARARPEFPLDRPVGLVESPTITYDGTETGWFRLEGEGWDPRREVYGNVAKGDEAHCILEWRTSHIGGGQIGTRLGETDAEASSFLLRSLALNPEESTSLNLRATNNSRIELMFAVRDDEAFSTGHAVRAFSASNHMLVFTIMCDRQGAVTPSLINDTLQGVRIELMTV